MSAKLFVQSTGSEVMERISNLVFGGLKEGGGNMRGEISTPRILIVDGAWFASVRSQ